MNNKLSLNIIQKHTFLHLEVFYLETDTAIKPQDNTNRHSMARIIVITIQQKNRCRLNALKQFCIQRFNDNDTDGDRAIT
jgi:hypothetical protein